MADAHEPDWQRLTAELRTFRDEQAEAWGGLDDFVIAKYVSGECSPGEVKHVDSILKQRPDVLETVEVLQETFQAPGLIPSPVDEVPAVNIWQTTPQGLFKLAIRLQVWLDETGRCVCAGLDSLLQQNKLAYRDMSSNTYAADDRSWTWDFPVQDAQYSVTVKVRPDDAAGRWQVNIVPHNTAGAELVDKTQIQIISASGKKIYQGALANLDDAAVVLRAGTWQISLDVDGDLRQIELDLGTPPAESPAQ